MSRHQRISNWICLCTIFHLVSPTYPLSTSPGLNLGLDLDLQDDGDSGGSRGPPHGGISGSHDGSFGYPSTLCKPCICDTKSRDEVISSVVNCSDQKLTRIPTSLPKSTSSLNFSGNRLTNHEELWSLCERYGDLKEVSFAENELKALPAVLKGCQNSLKNLTLTGNKLTVTNQSVFRHLQGLRSLRGLWVVNQLTQSAFRPLTSLARLEMTYAASVLPRDLFRPLASLRVLWLTLNGCQELPDGLTLPPGLTELRLRGIKLKHLPVGFLRNLDNIRSLHIDLPELRHLEWKPEDIATTNLEDLSVKGVWEITSESLAQMTSLSSLKLQDIRTLTDTAFFNHLGNLKNLEIINCSLASDGLQWMKTLHTLTSLALRQTQLAKLSSDTLSGLSALRNLDLSFNQLKRFPADLLLPVSDTLEGLDLSMNLLTHLEVIDFPSMPSLRGLDLSQNRLNLLNLDILMRTPSLSQLIVHGNALKDVRGHQIRGDTGSIQLSLLDLSSNLLETIPDNIPLEKVAILDMSNNPLTQGFPISRLDSLTTPTVVELHKTPVACHCDLYMPVAHGVLTGGICNSPPSVRHQALDQETMYALCNTTENDNIRTSKELSPMALVEAEEHNEKELEKKDDDDHDHWSFERTLGPSKVDGDSTSVVASFTATVESDSEASGSTENEQGVHNTGETSKVNSSEYKKTGPSEAFPFRPMESTSRMTFLESVSYTMDRERGTTLADHELHQTPEPKQEPSANATTDYPQQVSSSEPTSGTVDETNAGTDSLVTPSAASHGTYSDASTTVKEHGHLEVTDDVKDRLVDVAKNLAPDIKCSPNCSLEEEERQNSTSIYNQGLSKKGPLDDTDKSGLTLSKNMSSRLDSKGSADRSDNVDKMPDSDHSFPQLPWVIAVCFLLIMLSLGYIACRRRSHHGNHQLAAEAGNENKATPHGKMELMELGVAPPGRMPVIM